MAVFEVDTAVGREGSHRSESTEDRLDYGDGAEPVGDVKPIAVSGHRSRSSGYTQLTVTIPAKFADELDISADDYVLMQRLSNGSGIVMNLPDR